MVNLLRKLRTRAASAFARSRKQTPERLPLKHDALRHLVGRGVPIGSVIDVGVQAGTSSLIEALPDRPHLLIEPMAEWNPRIRDAYAAHSASYEIVNEAASDTDGTVTLKVRDVLAGEHPSHAFMVPDGEAVTGASRRVSAVRLDTLIARRNLPEPFLLKIDIDGPDMQVIAGGSETLKRTSVVILEAGVGNLLQRGGALRSAGFELFDLVDLCYYGTRLAQIDMIFLQSEIARDHRLDFGRETFAANLWTEHRP